MRSADARIGKEISRRPVTAGEPSFSHHPSWVLSRLHAEVLFQRGAFLRTLAASLIDIVRNCRREGFNSGYFFAKRFSVAFRAILHSFSPL
jgi:hypothetical protein